MRLISREVDFNPFESNNDSIRDFLFSNPGLMAFALYGLVFVVARKLSHYWLLIIWFVLVWISMYFLTPLRAKHLPIFLPLLAILAGLALHHILRFLKLTGKQDLSLRSVAMLLVIIVVLGMFAWQLPEVMAENNGQKLEVTENKDRLEAIQFIDLIARPDDCLIADNPVFIYQTGRLPPPELAETSHTRIATGHLTLQSIKRAVQRYECHVVAVVTPRFGTSLPGLREWLADNYLGLHAHGETYVYFALKESQAKAEDATYRAVHHDTFGHLVQLNGLRLSPQPWLKRSGGYISFFWQLKAPIDNQVIEQVIRLRHPGNSQPVYQLKRLPFEGFIIPASWPTNKQVRDTFRLNLPSELPAGTYDLSLSLCRPEGQECLPLDDTSQTELHLGQITLQP